MGAVRLLSLRSPLASADARSADSGTNADANASLSLSSFSFPLAATAPLRPRLAAAPLTFLPTRSVPPTSSPVARHPSRSMRLLPSPSRALRPDRLDCRADSVTSALDSSVGGEIRLRLLFEPLLVRPVSH